MADPRPEFMANTDLPAPSCGGYKTPSSPAVVPIHHLPPPAVSARFDSAEELKIFQEQVTFEDMVVDFTQEGWGQLEPAQRALYHDAMPETFTLLVSVGHWFPGPEVLFLLEQEARLWAVDSGDPQGMCPENLCKREALQMPGM
ncbi:zinc finger protein 135-like [Callospermophilus lateralis]|uniref:zinc finger protein 135-like n=1 Tax=Callospermophilus lateralis TaxID=76772 RepID=UPI0040547C25